MEDIKLWELSGTQAKALGLNKQLESEKLFEDTLVNNPDLLIDNLTLVGRQTPTEGGPLDLLGIDPEGKLVVFELKRGTVSRDAVAQIIDYASDLDYMDIDALADLISKKSGEHGIENFQEWYSAEFGELDSLKPLRLFLVGLGVDDRTERMVRFLAQNSGMDISLLTFHAFDYDGKTILAKQVEVEADAEPDRRPRRRRRTPAELDRDFDEKMEKYGTRDLVDDVRGMFKENWPASTEVMNSYGRRIDLGKGKLRRQYARIDAWREETISIVFFPRAKALCLNEFRGPVGKIRYVTWPQNRDPLGDPRAEIQFHLTPQSWETHKESLTALVQAVYAAWQNDDQNGGAESE